MLTCLGAEVGAKDNATFTPSLSSGVIKYELQTLGKQVSHEHQCVLRPIRQNKGVQSGHGERFAPSPVLPSGDPAQASALLRQPGRCSGQFPWRLAGEKQLRSARHAGEPECPAAARLVPATGRGEEGFFSSLYSTVSVPDSGPPPCHLQRAAGPLGKEALVIFPRRRLSAPPPRTVALAGSLFPLGREDRA